MIEKGYKVGSGNVFADIGLPNADEHLVKAQLVFKIDTLMKTRKMKHTQAAALFDVRQPDISKMLSGEFRQFSVERQIGLCWIFEYALGRNACDQATCEDRYCAALKARRS